MFEVDFLVIGSGLAGLNAALRLSAHGRVLVVTKRQIADSATAWAQGGIAGVLPELPDHGEGRIDDSFDSHVHDTLVAGAGLCDENAVTSIVSDAPRAIER